MNRALLGSASVVLALGAAAFVLDAEVLMGPRGAPLVVEAPGPAMLQPAGFDGCAPDPLLSEFAFLDGLSGARISGVALRGGLNAVVVSAEDPDAVPMVLIFDDADNLLGAGAADEVSALLPAMGCAAEPAPAPSSAGPV